MKVDVEQRGHVLLIRDQPTGRKPQTFDLELIDQFGAAYERLGLPIRSCGSAWCTRSVTISAAGLDPWQKSGRRSPRSDRGAGR